MSRMLLVMWLLLFSPLVGCAAWGVPAQDEFELVAVEGFDAAGFRDRLAKLPADAGWAHPFSRQRYLLEALEAAGWPASTPRIEIPVALQRAVVEALYDAARRPEWQHRRDQASTVKELAADLRRMCHIDKHVWIEVLHPYLNLYFGQQKSLDFRTAEAMAAGSEMLLPAEGRGILGMYVQLTRFARGPGGKRNLFAPEYGGLLHYLLIADPIAVTSWLYGSHPAEREVIGDTSVLLEELDHLDRLHTLDGRRLHSQQPSDTPAIIRFHTSPMPQEISDILVRLARDGGQPGQALAHYYSRGPDSRIRPELKQALLEAHSDYARWRFAELRRVSIEEGKR